MKKIKQNEIKAGKKKNSSDAFVGRLWKKDCQQRTAETFSHKK